MHLVDSLPTTVVGKIYKPALISDAVHRIVLEELSRAGLSGQVEVGLRDGRPHATVRLTAAGQDHRDRLSAELDGYSFTHEITS